MSFILAGKEGLDRGIRRRCSGPFSMADSDLVTRQLEASGYDGTDFFQRIDVSLLVGPTPEEAVEPQLESDWPARSSG